MKTQTNIALAICVSSSYFVLMKSQSNCAFGCALTILEFAFDLNISTENKRKRHENRILSIKSVILASTARRNVRLDL